MDRDLVFSACAKIGNRMKKSVVFLAFGIFAVCAQSQTSTVARPRILGIDHVSFYTTDPEGVKALYSGTLGLASVAPVESGELVRYLIGTQWVGYSSAPDPNAIDRMDHVAFASDDVTALRKYLIANGLKVSAIKGHDDQSLSFFVDDPEGHRIEFVSGSLHLKEAWLDAKPGEFHAI
jgi:catechol 2,3-dioxygenase-like lactoylglutathione lyase family enzyme